MERQPLVSILTNTKNRANLIPLCIESIRNQTYTNYEHIIADGGDDETAAVVASYNDPHIKYIKVSEGGVYAQTKKAFEVSKGEYITFLDDDDEYLPEKIEKQVELITSLPEDYGFIYGAMTYYDFQTKKQVDFHPADYSGENLLELSLTAPIICGMPTLMFRREVFEKLGGSWIQNIGDPSSDWAMACKALRAGYKVGALKESYLRIYVNHGFQRLSSEAATAQNATKHIQFHKYFLEEYDDIFEARPELAKNHIENLIYYHLILKDYRSAFRYWKKLLSDVPGIRSLLVYPYYYLKLKGNGNK